MTYKNDLFIRAAHGEHTERTPVWYMRQAGRTDPVYLATKERANLPLEDLFCHPEWSAEITLLPKRLGVDALIYFQDILTPLGPMGAPFVFRPGPVNEVPILGPTDLDRLQPYDVEPALPCVRETFSRIHALDGGELPVLGFAGAPMTLGMFALEGKSPGKNSSKSLTFMREYPDVFAAFIDRMADVTIEYLKFQIDSGAAAVQLFESCACMVDTETYARFALPAQQKIFAALKGLAPTIIFAREWPSLDELAAAGADIISLPAEIDFAEARAALGPDQVLQGNLDNKLLASGSMDDVLAEAKRIIEAGNHDRHIFNLSHGLLRETPFERIQELTKYVLSLGSE